MPGLRESIANFLAPRDEEKKEVNLGSEMAYSETLYNTGNNAYKYDPDLLKSRRGYNIYNRMMVDEQVKAVVRFRRDAITGREYFFKFDTDVELSEEEQKRRIDMFKFMLEEMKGSFNDSLNMIMTGVWQGYSITEKIHDTIEYKGKPYIGIHKLKKKPHETFKFVVDKFGNVKRLEQEYDGITRVIPLDKMIHYVQNPDTDEHYGGSELREAYRSWFSKDVAIKFWNIFLERSASGMWIARVKDGQTVSPQSTEYTSIIAMLQSLSSASSALIPSKIDLEHISPQSTSEFKLAVEFHDLSIAKALLVPNLLGISHTGQTGAFSQSQTQFKAFTLVLEADTTRLESTLDEQVFRELGELNFADGLYPKFKFKPLSIEQIMEMLVTWKDLIGSDAVEPSDTDEAHIRNLLEMPEKGEPLPRRADPLRPPGSDDPPINDDTTADDPDQVDEIRNRAAWRFAKSKAENRVRFAVIDRRSSQDVVIGVERLDLAVGRIVAEMIETVVDQRLGTANSDVDKIGKLTFLSSQKQRIRSSMRRTLEKGWKLGTKHATDEINASRGNTEFRAHMGRLEENAADYFKARAFSMAGGFSAEVETIIKNSLANGLKMNWTTTEVVDNIYKRLVRKGMMMTRTAAGGMSLTEEELLEALEGAGLTAHRLETIVRTNFFEALNEARYNMFTDPSLGEYVQAMEYSAILDSRTTAICEHLDGSVFNRESDNWEKYRPPNHMNCRSLLIAVTENDVWKESKKPTLDPQDGFGTK